MSAFENTSPSTMTDKAWRTPRITVAQLFLRAIRRWQRSRAINELSLLDDRQLNDIGISRNDIPRVVKGLFGPEELRAKPPSEPLTRAENANVAVAAYSRAA